MSWKFIFYDWGGLNAALFHLINQGTPIALSPVAWIFSNLLGHYWTAPLFMLGLWVWSRAAKEADHGAAIRHQLICFLAAFVLAMGVSRQTLYRHVGPDGSLRETGRKLLA